MTTEIMKMLEDYAEAWSSHDVEKIASHVTDDFIFENVATGTIFHGKEELKAYLEETFNVIPDFKLDVKSLFFAENWVGAEWVETGTFTGEIFGIQVNNKSICVRGASIGELKEGKLKRESIYWDLATYLKQLGLMPEVTP